MDIWMDWKRDDRLDRYTLLRVFDRKDVPSRVAILRYKPWVAKKSIGRQEGIYNINNALFTIVLLYIIYYILYT